MKFIAQIKTGLFVFAFAVISMVAMCACSQPLTNKEIKIEKGWLYSEEKMARMQMDTSKLDENGIPEITTFESTVDTEIEERPFKSEISYDKEGNPTIIVHYKDSEHGLKDAEFNWESISNYLEETNRSYDFDPS